MEEQFIQWSKETIKSSNINSVKQPLTVLHVSKLLKVKNVKPILSYLMNHFRPASERSYIRLNLKHANLRKQMTEHPGGGATLCRGAVLASQVQEVKASVESDLDELLHMRIENEKLIQKEQELLNQITILNLAIKKAEMETEKYNSWCLKIPGILPKEHCSGSLSSPQDDSIKQEAIKELLLHINVQLRDLRHNFVNIAVDDIHDNKIELWKAVEELLLENSPHNIMKALESITEADIAHIRQCTSLVDLQKDARELRFKYESSGQFVDELGNGGILETVQMLLVHMNGMHIKSHFHNAKLKREVNSTIESIATVKKSIGNGLEECYRDDPSRLMEMKNYIEQSINIAGQKAALSQATKLSKELEGRELSANKAMHFINEKHSRILSFNNKVKQGMRELQNLNFKIQTSRTALQEDLATILAHLEDHFNKIELPIITTELSLVKEAQAFLGIPLNSLHAGGKASLTPIESYIQTNYLEATIGDSLLKLTPTITSWGNLVEMVLQRKELLRSYQDDLLRETRCVDQMEKMEGKKDFAETRIKGLYRKAIAFDKDLQQKLLPNLEVADDILNQYTKKLKDVQDAVHDWWTQPAKYIIKNLRSETL